MALLGAPFGCPGQLNLARSIDSLPWAQRPQGHLERLTFVSSGALEALLPHPLPHPHPHPNPPHFPFR